LLHHIFTNQTPLASIKSTLHHLHSLHATLIQALPEALRVYCHSVYWSEKKLILNITNSTAMSKIRQLCPDLVKLLQAQGVELTKIKPVRFFEIQQAAASPKIQKMTPAALKAFQHLQQNVSDTRLKQALTTLLKAHRPVLKK
jgi:hypothetical protein